MAFTPTQDQELNTAYQRIQAGAAGVASANNAGDQANVDYAISKGWKPSTVPTTTNAGAIGGTPAPVGATTPTDTTTQAMASFTPQQIVDQTKEGLSTTPAVTQAESQYSSISQKLLEAIQGKGNQGEALMAQEAALGVPEQTKKLAELNSRIAQVSGEYNKSIEGLSGGVGLSTTIAGKQGQLRRQQAVEVGALTAQAQAIQGNIAQAQQTAQRTVALEFEDKQNQIDLLKEQLSLNYENLTRAEKKQADELSLVLAERQRRLDTEKETRNNIMNLMVNAAENGADQQTLDKIKNSKSIDDAIFSAGPILGAKFKAQIDQQNFDNALRLRDQAIQEGKLVKATSGGAGGSGGTVVSPEEIGISKDAANWINLIRQNKATIANVPANLKNEVVNGLSSTVDTTDTPEETAAKQKVALIDNLLNHSGLSGVVGPISLARLRPIASLTGSSADFLAGVQQLVSQQTLNSLLELKKGGGTLGALSDQERVMLQSAATKIGSWALRDANGNVYAYKASEKAFKQELNNLKEIANKAIKRSILPEAQSMEDGTEWIQNADGTFTQIEK